LIQRTAGSRREPLIWSCAFGHIFAASPFLILTGGHWCPHCTRDSVGYERQAEHNAFLAQLYASRTPARHDEAARH